MGGLGGLADVSLGDVGRALARYRPVVATVAAILVVVVLADPIPRPRRGGEPGPASFGTPLGAATGAAPASDAGAAALAPLTEPPLLGSLPEPGPLATVPQAEAPTSGFSIGDSVVTPSEQAAVPADRSLRVRAKGWATATAGTPLAAVGVPAGTLPVGTRLGQADKTSYVRLGGGGSVLVLVEDPAGTRTTQGDPSVQACQVTEQGWQEKEAMSFDEAPEHDPATCAVGTRAADGRWTFDLGQFPSRTDDRGLALVPTADAPIDFQVAFTP